MDSQLIIVFIILIAATGYVVRSIYKNAKGHSCETGNCKCEGKRINKV